MFFSTRNYYPETGSHHEKQQQKVRIHVVIVDFCDPIRMTCVQQRVKLNHFAKVCLSKQSKSHDKSNAHEQPQPQHKNRPNSHIHHVVSSEPHQKSDSSSDEYLHTLGETANTTAPKLDVKLNGITISMMIDTGASTDIIEEKNILLK